MRVHCYSIWSLSVATVKTRRFEHGRCPGSRKAASNDIALGGMTRYDLLKYKTARFICKANKNLLKKILKICLCISMARCILDKLIKNFFHVGTTRKQIIIMVIFKRYFSGEHIALSINKINKENKYVLPNECT